MNDRLQPAFWGGLFIGVLSALPLINFGNCCCCLWVLCGGALAAYLRNQNSPVQIEAAEGALVGLIAGAIGGVIASVLSIPFQMFVGDYSRQMMERILASNPDVPAETREAIERFSSGAGGVAMRFVGMLVSVVIDVIFGMLGGLLGVAIFKKNSPPPPGTVEVLPPA
jgi:hypothetical protein